MPSRDQALQAIKTLIEYIGDDPDRDGLRDTPDRVIRAWDEFWGRGYKVKRAEEMLRIFPLTDNDTAFNQMVFVRDIEVNSVCEHHMAPFTGVAHIAYIPGEGVAGTGVIGLSKLARITDYFSRRLQVQERLTEQIADFLENHFASVGVMLVCHHTCMSSRGVCQANAMTQTTALRGDFYDDPQTRSEFLLACRTAASR